MITALNLTKRYQKHTVVNRVSLDIDQGQIFGLLGPNAAGKTTVIRMLCGIIEADDGQIRINNQPISDAKAGFGYVAQYFGQYEELSVWENIRFYARMYDVTDKGWLLELMNRYALTAYKDQLAGLLSGGYKRRLALVCALTHNPEVLFLDEPTAGIDPATRKLLWDDFYRLSAEGKTLFVTTHYMEEAQRCHQLAFISAGKIVARGSPATIKKALGDACVFAGTIAYKPELRDALSQLTGMILINQFGDELRLVVQPELAQAELESTIERVTREPHRLHRSEPNLEDVFIALTQDKV